MITSKNKHLWKKMRRISKRKQASHIEYTKLRKVYLAKHPICQCCDYRQSTEIHHKKGRGIFLCAIEFFMGVCCKCHRRIEQDRDWAFKKGYRLDRIGNNNEPTQIDQTLS